MFFKRYDNYWTTTLYYSLDTNGMRLAGCGRMYPRVGTMCTKVIAVIPDIPKESGTDLVMYMIDDEVRTPVKGKKVFIAPESKMSRDLVRRDYSIVRDIDKADYVVVPNQKVTLQRYRFLFEFESKGETNLVIGFMSISSSHDYDHNSLPEDRKKIVLGYISGYLENRFGEEPTLLSEGLCDDWEARYTLVFMKDVDAITKAYGKKKTVIDYNLPITTTNKISPEQLLVWGYCDSDDVVFKELADSDWYDYPFTVCLFLRKRFAYMPLSIVPGCAKPLLAKVKYKDNYSYSRMPEDYEVSSKDWEMAQDYQMALLGIQGKVGHINYSNTCFDVLPYGGEYLRKCVTVGRYAMPTNSMNLAELSSHL